MKDVEEVSLPKYEGSTCRMLLQGAVYLQNLRCIYHYLKDLEQ